MSYQISLPPKVARKLSRFHPIIKKRIRNALRLLTMDAYQGKALQEELKGFYTYRVSRYRIIYQIDHKTIQVHSIGHRGTVYREIY